MAGIGLSIPPAGPPVWPVRYAAGTPPPDPAACRSPAPWPRPGFRCRFCGRRTTDVGRRYQGVRAGDGAPLEVFVLDRDLEGAGLARRCGAACGCGVVGQRLQIRGAASNNGPLMSHAAANAGAPTTPLLAAREIGPDSEPARLRPGRRSDAGRCSRTRSPTRSSTTPGPPWPRCARPASPTAGSPPTICCSNPTAPSGCSPSAKDRPQPATWCCASTSPRCCARWRCSPVPNGPSLRTSGPGTRGPVTALPVLQPVALSPTTKRAVRKNKQSIDLRDQLIELRPDAEVEPHRTRAGLPRTLLMIIVGSIAVHVPLSQLAQVNRSDCSRTPSGSGCWSHSRRRS